jgi:hypothetical protein
VSSRYPPRRHIELWLIVEPPAGTPDVKRLPPATSLAAPGMPSHLSFDCGLCGGTIFQDGDVTGHDQHVYYCQQCGGFNQLM